MLATTGESSNYAARCLVIPCLAPTCMCCCLTACSSASARTTESLPAAAVHARRYVVCAPTSAAVSGARSASPLRPALQGGVTRTSVYQLLNVKQHMTYAFESASDPAAPHASSIFGVPHAMCGSGLCSVVVPMLPLFQHLQCYSTDVNAIHSTGCGVHLCVATSFEACPRLCCAAESFACRALPSACSGSGTSFGSAST